MCAGSTKHLVARGVQTHVCAASPGGQPIWTGSATHELSKMAGSGCQRVGGIVAVSRIGAVQCGH